LEPEESKQQQHNREMKFLKRSVFSIAAASIIVLAIALRLVLLALGWPPLDSDSGTIGLMGMHIAYRGEWPIFFYAQGYMGVFEAYLAAVMFQLFGVSPFTLALGLVLMYGVFLVAIYQLTGMLYSWRLALFVLVLLCLGSNPMLSREMVAIGGYPETLLFGTLVMVLAAWLALTSYPRGLVYRGPERWRRLIAYAAWGLVAGVGIWTHMLIAPFVLVSGLLILFFCRRELWGWAGGLLFVALVIGLLPMIIYNVMAGPGQDTLSYLLRVHSASGYTGSGYTLPPFFVIFPQQLVGAFLISLPTATGVNPLCSATDALSPGLSNWHAIQCTLVHTGWSAGLTFLWLLATVLTVGALWPIWRKRRGWSGEERREAILYTARLMLLASAGLTMALYVISPDAAVFSVATSRYLIGLLVATPAVLWPLWSGAQEMKPLVLKLSREIAVSVRLARFSLALRRGLLALILAVFLFGTFSIFSGIPPALPVEHHWGVFATQVNDQHLGVPAVQAINRQEYALIDNLLHNNIHRIYSDYWTCDRLMFQSQERIICSVLDDNLRNGHNRYQPYYAIVSADPQAAYVLEAGSPQAGAFAQYVATTLPPYQNYQQLEMNGYVIYRPKS
jgi:hypothetical protein